MEATAQLLIVRERATCLRVDRRTRPRRRLSKPLHSRTSVAHVFRRWSSAEPVLAFRSREPGTVAPFTLIDGSIDSGNKVQAAVDFLQAHDLSFPVVLKPDVGERGAGVAVIRSQEELRSYFGKSEGDIIIQKYIAG